MHDGERDKGDAKQQWNHPGQPFKEITSHDDFMIFMCFMIKNPVRFASEYSLAAD